MGDRGNIVIVQHPWRQKPEDPLEFVVFYTHWSGCEIGSTVQAALQKHWRWDDPAYLARIIFDVLTSSAHDEETGFGISTGICDNEHPILIVDTRNKQISFAGEKDWKNPNAWYGHWTYEEFCALSDANDLT